MEHKPIYVDGVDVSGCKYCNLRKHHDIVSDELWEVCYSKDCKYSTCANNPNCYYKQLARKTQECEELKAYAQRQENQREEYHKEYLKKDKALEEIEGIANVLITETNEYESCYYKDSCGDNCYPRIAKVSEHSLGRQTYCQYEAVAKILDIINEAKGGV